MIPSLKLLFDRCNHVGFCRLWTQGTNAKGVPIISLSSKQRARSVRPIAYQLIFGQIPPGRYVYVDCGNVNCISGKCMKIGTKSEYMLAASRRGAYSGLDVSRVRANAARQRSKLIGGMAAARKIRADRAAGKLLKDIAAEHNISIDVASKIARGLLWREASANSSVFHMAA